MLDACQPNAYLYSTQNHSTHEATEKVRVQVAFSLQPLRVTVKVYLSSYACQSNASTVRVCPWAAASGVEHLPHPLWAQHPFPLLQHLDPIFTGFIHWFCFCFENSLTHSPCWPAAHYVVQAGRELLEIFLPRAGTITTPSGFHLFISGKDNHTGLT